MPFTAQLGQANSTLANIGLGVPPIVAATGGITFVSSLTAALGQVGGTTGTFNSTGANCVVVSVQHNFISTPTVTDNKGNTYTGLTVTAGSPVEHTFFYVLNPTVGTGHTVTVGKGGGGDIYVSVIVNAFSGVASYFGQSSGGIGTTSPLSGGGVTPTTNGSLIVTGIAGAQAGLTDVVPTGFTSSGAVGFVGGASYSGAAAYLVQPTAGSITPAWTWTGTRANNASVSTAVFVPIPSQTAILPTRASTAVLNAPAILNAGSVTAPFRASTVVLNVPLVQRAVVQPPFRTSTARLFTPAITFPGYLEDARLECVVWRYTHTAALNLTLAPATLHSIAWGTEYGAIVDVVLDDATLFARIFQPIAARMSLQTAQAVTHIVLHGGVVPTFVGLSGPRIYNVTGPVRASGGTILCFIGPPNKSVDWRLLQGVGTLTPFTTFTDEQGRCSCRFDAAGIIGKVVIGAAWVP